MTEERKGVLAIAAAATIWGLSGIYYKALSAVPPLEVLSHRTLWSAVFFLGVLAAQGRVGEALGLLARPRAWAPLAASAVLIAVNWLLFIAAVQQGRALEASLGYYIFPLLAVALGFLVLGERFTPRQSAAIGLAAVAVVVLTPGHGRRALDGARHRRDLRGLRADQEPGAGRAGDERLRGDAAARAAGARLARRGCTAGAFGRDWGTSAMLAFSGPLTGGPLMLFAYAARRIPYATVGLVQYLNPTLQFAVAVALFGEPFTVWHARGVRADLGGARALFVGELAAGVIPRGAKGLRRFVRCTHYAQRMHSAYAK